MDTVDIPVEIRCPQCRAFEWFRDGLLVHELDRSGVVRMQLYEPSVATAVWSCTQCGYEVPARAVLHRQLDQVATADARRPRRSIAFARERDADAALRLVGGLTEHVEYGMSHVRNERDAVELVIVEAVCEEEPTCDKVETIFAGSRGIVMPADERPAEAAGDYFNEPR